MKRLLVVSDLHCGHLAGLTPPEWRIGKKAHPAIYNMQDQCWRAYRRMISKLNPDICVCNGDAMDGKGNRSGGTEQRESDLLEQAEMATECLKDINAAKYYLTYGTPYHVSSSGGEDMEKLVARNLGAEIHGHWYLNVGGVMFDFKHKVGASSVPHGRHTAIARERLWNILWAEREDAPRADVLVRSHVHYHSFAGGPGWLAMTTPALQAPGTKYGSRECSGVVDFGIVVFDINKGRIERWQAKTIRLQNIAEVINA